MNEQQIKAAFQLAAKETLPPMALGHIGEWWFRKGVTAAMATLATERAPYAWEVTQGGRTFLLSAQEFAGKSYDCATFKPLYQD